MNGLRRHWLERGGIYAVLLLCALSVRLLVPTGFMPVQSDRGIVISLCTGEGAKTAVLHVPQSGDSSGKGDHHGHDHAAPCAFAALAAPALQGHEPLLFSVATVLLREIVLPPPVYAVIASPAHIFPPLRGPPAATA